MIGGYQFAFSQNPFARRVFAASCALLGMLVGDLASAQQLGSRLPSTDGYVFIDGQYISPPYDIQWAGDALTISGHQFDKDSFDLSDYRRSFSGERSSTRERLGKRGRRGMRPGPRRRIDDDDVSRTGFHPERFRQARSSFSRFCEDLNAVETGMVAVLYQHQRPLLLYRTSGGYEMLMSLVDPSHHLGLQSDWGRDRNSQEMGNRLLAEFSPSVEFQRRAKSDLALVQAASDEGDRVIATTYWLERLSFPLTVFAMAMVVLGFGHLLSNQPNLEKLGSGPGDSLKRRKVVGQSLLIVGLLSAVDLIWTISTANAGAMRELNPLGSGLIGQPVVLFLFKATVTGMAIAILYRLHRRPIAQVASWWCCLLLTLLTARWVVFQSMFL